MTKIIRERNFHLEQLPQSEREEKQPQQQQQLKRLDF